MGKPFDWDEAFQEIADANRASYDAAQTPEKIAAQEAKRQSEFERGVRFGWHDAEGNPLPADDEGEDEDEDEVEEDQ